MDQVVHLLLELLEVVVPASPLCEHEHEHFVEFLVLLVHGGLELFIRQRPCIAPVVVEVIVGSNQHSEEPGHRDHNRRISTAVVPRIHWLQRLPRFNCGHSLAVLLVLFVDLSVGLARAVLDSAVRAEPSLEPENDFCLEHPPLCEPFVAGLVG
eukprot:299053-Rhodomonas_salina.3